MLYNLQRTVLAICCLSIPKKRRRLGKVGPFIFKDFKEVQEDVA